MLAKRQRSVEISDSSSSSEDELNNKKNSSNPRSRFFSFFNKRQSLSRGRSLDSSGLEENALNPSEDKTDSKLHGAHSLPKPIPYVIKGILKSDSSFDRTESRKFKNSKIANYKSRSLTKGLSLDLGVVRHLL